ncbi:DEAD/DEAH box helicase family protein [Weissella diestrammenae]|uniref:DEAD/DEAH box helicase family protein n=1 Tax=Weissella diestrammenae TaxID=1162633 RepID=A0A7G9T3X7_9LACO|nr:helicase-related protein [Weissella diestrammenae]MCM0582998.1 DEAD/DEAH box helicase family protein [Weissella diestrammenae]QNN74802.1 DEAD/DEAH box helicase family protein [Weissella diestrammenae]
MTIQLFYGRQVKLETPRSDVEISPAILNNQCQRCLGDIKKQWRLPNEERYCWHCHLLGRVRESQYFGYLPEPHAFILPTRVCSWTGELTPAQKQISQAQLQALTNHSSHLTYAVTGAGKTEMIFPLLIQAIQQKKRIALVAPRVDVVIELNKRIHQFFLIDSVCCYGDSLEHYRYTQLLIATTHQLMHFKAAFDVIIVDEGDAFPYVNDQRLQVAVQQALLEKGSIFYLTATPSKQLMQQVRQQILTYSILTQRFHGHHLPQLTIKVSRYWRHQLPRYIKNRLKQYQQIKRQFLIFVPQVTDLQLIYNQISDVISIGMVHADSPKRHQLIEQMREKKLLGLITTTILERGVTFVGIDVIILGADELPFNETALIQIAGRCGRSIERPTGLVLAIVSEVCYSVLAANNEIKYLNALR